MRIQITNIPAAVLACALLLVPALRGQMSDEEKKQLFLQSREDIRPVPKPSPSATARPKPKPQTTPRATPEDDATPRPKPRTTPRDTPDDEEPPKPRPKPTPRATPEDEETPRPKPRATPDDEEPPKPKPRATPEDEEPPPTPKPKGSATPDFIPLPTDLGKPAPEEKPQAKPTPPSPEPAISPAQIPTGKTPAGHALDAPILVEKSGLEQQEGYEPPSKPLFGGFFKRWRYLSPGVRKAIDQARVQRGRWKYIIVHNSGTRQGNARVFEVYHRRVRKMQNGLAYHFVIGNGNSSGDGEIEIGNRWTRQINGGHVASDYLNNIALGICLVGDLNRDKPTAAQLGALDELITYLRGRVGKVKGKPSIVKAHKEINPKPTDCPGDRFPYGWLHQKFD